MQLMPRRLKVPNPKDCVLPNKKVQTQPASRGLGHVNSFLIDDQWSVSVKISDVFIDHAVHLQEFSHVSFIALFVCRMYTCQPSDWLTRLNVCHQSRNTLTVKIKSSPSHPGDFRFFNFITASRISSISGSGSSSVFLERNLLPCLGPSGFLCISSVCSFHLVKTCCVFVRTVPSSSFILICFPVLFPISSFIVIEDTILVEYTTLILCLQFFSSTSVHFYSSHFSLSVLSAF